MRRTLGYAALLLTLIPVPSEAQRFAGAIAVGDTEVIVGEAVNSYRPGTVYIYRKNGAEWREAARLTAPDARPRDGFGAGLAVNGNTLYVSTANGGPVQVFTRSGTAWRHSTTIAAPATGGAERFGAAIAAAGDFLFVGAPARVVGGGGRGGPGGGGGRAGGPAPELPSGSVYVYRPQGASFTQVARLAASDVSQGDAFGASISVADNNALIGAPGKNNAAGAAYAFSYDNASGSWRESGRMTPRTANADQQFGAAVAVMGDNAAVGSPRDGGGYGVTHIFARNPQGVWQEQQRLAVNGANTDAFGTTIAIAAPDVWIGVPGSADRFGGVHVFSRDPQRGILSVSLPLPRTGAQNDRFGGTLAVRGSIAAIGSPGAAGNTGSVSIYEREGANWVERTTIVSEVNALPAVTGGEVRCGEDGKAKMFDCKNAELVSFLPIHMITMANPRSTRLSGNWGWTHARSGREFALVGRNNGMSFIEVTDPKNPKFIGDLPLTPGANPSSWREVKTYKDHAYIVSDGAGRHGMQVFDLTQLLAPRTAPVLFEPTTLYTRINSAHNIVINEETGYAFSTGGSSGGETCGGGLHMMNLKDPKNPEFVGCFAHTGTGRTGTGYTHDAQCVKYNGPDRQYRGREICLGANETALSIADVSDKKNPKALSQATYPKVAYTHQGWLTADHRYFYSNDELDETGGLVDMTRTLVWDLLDLNDPKLLTEFMGTTKASDHNLYVLGNTMYQSNYIAGLRIIDITKRGEPVEIGYFDTVPYSENTPGFSGTWSNYPFFKNGAILVTSGGEGMFLIKKRAVPIL